MRDNGFLKASPSGNSLIDGFKESKLNLTPCSGDSYTEEQIDIIMERIRESNIKK